ncbi:hypothetical protein PAXRUDRAFT_15838 [Paxillus rubicundulus Ve08.2h10]|uniref:Uncharacterized protein n=1 Tax=Paxillus rubicundulus Ve08.2h10 TaxID=930991 RepID=A0A0D0D9A5_9AGAM|nr:hypothetical protein PAXRUDRAFT_15838 [Paxillus rubicundulus Ve08.2h10]
MEIFEEYLDQLADAMQGSLGKISFATDVWSDMNLVPFMVVTAHWIQAVSSENSNGAEHVLKLHADLIGFHQIPRWHDGEHLAATFLYLLDWLEITIKIGWVMLNNTSNNDTLLLYLETELQQRGISFDRVKQHICCFPHIINLACKAVLKAMTNLDFTKDDVEDYVPDTLQPRTLFDAVEHDPIAIVQSLVRGISASSLWRQYFSAILKALEKKDLQLL